MPQLKSDLTVTCEDILSFGDGYGDTYRFACMLGAGHSGPHRDEFEHEGKSVVVTWQADDDTVSIVGGEHPPLVR